MHTIRSSYRRALLAAALVAAGMAAGLALAPKARAGAQAAAGTPIVSFDVSQAETQAAAFFNANGITTDAGRATFVAGITAGSATELAVVKAFANCFILRPAPSN